MAKVQVDDSPSFIAILNLKWLIAQTIKSLFHANKDNQCFLCSFYPMKGLIFELIFEN